MHQHLSQKGFNLQHQEEYQKEMGAQPMDFTDGIEKIRGNKSGEFEKVFDSLHGDRSVTPGSPGKLEIFVFHLFFFSH
jgi:cohesin complex subunit SCC1